MADDAPNDDIHAYLKAIYGHGTDPVIDLQWPHIPPPAGSVAMQQRGPWMRKYLEGLHPEYGKQIADFLVSAMTAPMALPASRTGIGVGRDAVMARSLEKQFPTEKTVTGGTDPNSAYTVPGSAASIFRNHNNGALWEGLPGENLGEVGTPGGLMREMLPTRMGERAANANEPNWHRGGPEAKYWDAFIDQVIKRESAPPPPSAAELAARPGARPAGDVVFDADPTMKGAKSGNFYRGPETPANDHPPGPYDQSYNRALQMQRKAAEDAFIDALLRGKAPPHDPFRD